MTPLRMIVARIAVRFGLNLNWVFCPALSWRRGEKPVLDRARQGG